MTVKSLTFLQLSNVRRVTDMIIGQGHTFGGTSRTIYIVEKIILTEGGGGHVCIFYTWFLA